MLGLLEYISMFLSIFLLEMFKPTRSKYLFIYELTPDALPNPADTKAGSLLKSADK